LFFYRLEKRRNDGFVCEPKRAFLMGEGSMTQTSHITEVNNTLGVSLQESDIPFRAKRYIELKNKGGDINTVNF